MPTPFDDRSVLDVAYEGSFYPYLYDGRDGAQRGFIPIMWEIIGQALRKNIRYNQISNQQVQIGNESFTVADLTTQNGSYLTFIDGAEMDPRLMKWARFTVPFLYGRYQIYESRGEHEHEASFLSYYLVFSWSSILLLAICAVVFNCTLWLHKRLLRKQHKGFLSHSLLSLARALFLLSVTLTTFYHGAYFRGDTIVTVPPKQTTLSTLLSSLDTLQRYLLLDVHGKASPPLLSFFNDRVQFQPDKAAFFKQLCSDSKAVTFLFSGEKYQRTLINATCYLNPISISTPERATYKPFAGFAIDHPYFIITSRNFTSSKITKRINTVILRMFQDQQISSLWNPRSVDSLRHYYDDETQPKAEFNPMSFEQLSIVFYLLIGGNCASILLMAFEIVYYKVLHRHNLISALQRRSSKILQKYSVTK